MHATDSIDRTFMGLALDLARQARDRGEVPVGALVVLGLRVIGQGQNASIRHNDPTAHAEVLALREAAAAVANHRLPGTVLYSTVEPCLMCVGAAIQARVGRVVFGAADPKLGGMARLTALRELGAAFNHRFEVTGGLEAEQASALLLDFFRERRGIDTSPWGP